MTLLERARHFPTGVKELYNACLVYRNIHDASRTPLNAWTIDHPLMWRRQMQQRHSNGGSGGGKYQIYGDELRPGRIPRRQHEQQRRLVDDVKMVAPLIVVWILPIVGYFPMFLAAGAPRQVLCRQFFNDYEVRHFAEIEYRQRKDVYPELGRMFWKMTAVGHRDCADAVPVVESSERRNDDDAGPVIDPMPLYSVFCNRSGTTHELKLRRGVLSSTERMPRDYLVALALAVGLNQNFPPNISSPLTSCCPSLWLRFRIRKLAKVVVEDDELLLLEGHDANGCESLTDVEVMDACLMRGLPVGIPAGGMRLCLTNHLKMIAAVKDRIPREAVVSEEGFGLFTLHLAIIRNFLKEKIVLESR